MGSIMGRSCCHSGSEIDIVLVLLLVVVGGRYSSSSIVYILYSSKSSRYSKLSTVRTYYILQDYKQYYNIVKYTTVSIVRTLATIIAVGTSSLAKWMRQATPVVPARCAPARQWI